jgi:hypothetical protein
MISKLTSEIIDKCIIEFNKNENKKKIFDNLIDPTVIYILDKLYPYIVVTCTILIIIIVILIISLFYIIKKLN